MRKIMVLLMLLLVLAGCASAEEDLEAGPTEPIESPGVFVDGYLVPCQDAGLAFPVSGEVEEILAGEGEAVLEGAALAQLNGSASIEAQLTNVEALIMEAQLALDALLDAAEVDRADAWQRVLDSRLLITAAQEALDDFDMDRYEDDLEDSDTRIAEAEADLEEAQDALRDYADLDLDNPTYRRYEDDVEDAQEELHEARQEREELEVEYEQLQLNMERAEALYALAMDQYSDLRDGPDPEQEALLQARIDALDANRLALEDQRDDLTLRVPFDAVVADVDLVEGTMVAAGQPVVWAADFSCWYIETEDLTEYEVVRIQEGDEITAVPDALPESTLYGIVESISLLPTDYLGDVTYTARILLEEVPAEARWGMTVVLQIPE